MVLWPGTPNHEKIIGAKIDDSASTLKQREWGDVYDCDVLLNLTVLSSACDPGGATDGKDAMPAFW